MDGESFALLLLAGAKWVTYLGLMGLTGAVAVSRLLAPATGVVEPRGGVVDRRLRLVAAVSAVVLVLGAAARLYAQTWSVFGLDERVTLELVRLIGIESRWAGGWQPQAGVAVLAVVGAAWWTRSPRGGWWLTALAAAGAWITLPLTGHAASFESPLPHLAQVAHGIGAGLWVGGLAAVVAVTSRLRREPEGQGRVADLVRRFSPMALAAVSTIALSGVVTGVFYLGSVDDCGPPPTGAPCCSRWSSSWRPAPSGPTTGAGSRHGSARPPARAGCCARRVWSCSGRGGAAGHRRPRAPADAARDDVVMHGTASAQDVDARARQARRPPRQAVENRRRTESAGAPLAESSRAPWGTSPDSLQFAPRCAPRLLRTRFRDRDVDSRTNAAHPTPQPRLRPETGRTMSPATQKLTTYLVPGNRRGGVLKLRRPAPVQLHLLLRGEDELRITLGVGETIPQRHRNRGPFRNGKLEQCRDRGGSHDSILSPLGLDGQGEPGLRAGGTERVCGVGVRSRRSAPTRSGPPLSSGARSASGESWRGRRRWSAPRTPRCT